MNAPRSSRPLPIDPSDLHPIEPGALPEKFTTLPSHLRSELRRLSVKKAREVVQALDDCSREAAHRALLPGDIDVFTLPGKYRYIGRYSAAPSAPQDEVTTLLKETLCSDGSNPWWCICLSFTEVICVTRAVFLQNWQPLCHLATEAADIYPPDGSWILQWQKDESCFVLHRRNPAPSDAGRVKPSRKSENPAIRPFSYPRSDDREAL